LAECGRSAYRRRMKIWLSGLGAALLAAGCGPIAAARWSYHCEAPVPSGGTCLGEGECDVGLRCVSGRCTPVGRAGEACEGLHACADGLNCFVTYTTSGRCMATTCSEAGRDTGNCTTTGPTGRACDADFFCRPLEVCAIESTSAGACRAIPGRGESCDGFPNFACQPGLVCRLDTHTCEVPTLGASCGIASEAIDNSCGRDLGCDFRDDGTSVCIPRIAPGGACNNESCQAGYHCSTESRRCERDRSEGDSCVNGNECGVALGRNLDCVARRCVRIDREGATCWPGHYGCTGGLRCLRDR
jgi:hypothetical protein